MRLPRMSRRWMGLVMLMALLMGGGLVIRGGHRSGGGVMRAGPPDPAKAPPPVTYRAPISPDSRYAMADGYLLDLGSGEVIRTVGGCTRGVMAFFPDDRLAMTVASENLLPAIKVWDVVKDQPVRTLEALRPSDPHFRGNGTCCFAVSPDGKTGLSGHVNGRLKYWDLVEGKLIQVLGEELWGQAPLSSDHKADFISFTPDGRTALEGFSTGGRLMLWDLASGREIRTIETFMGHSLLAHSPDGKFAVTGRARGDTVDPWLVLWDLADGREVRRFRINNSNLNLIMHKNYIISGRFSPDGRNLLTANWETSLVLWDVASGEKVRAIRLDELASCVVFSPDSTRALVGTYDGSLRCLNLADGKPLWRLKAR